MLDTPSSIAMNQQALRKRVEPREDLGQIEKYVLEVSTSSVDRLGERIIVRHFKFGYILQVQKGRPGKGKCYGESGTVD